MKFKLILSSVSVIAATMVSAFAHEASAQLPLDGCGNGCLYTVDGVCVPKRTTYGFHQTHWRRWPSAIDSASCRPGIQLDACVRHHGFCGAATGTRNAALRQSASCVTLACSNSDLHGSGARRRVDVAVQHAAQVARSGRRDSPGRLRNINRWKTEHHLSKWNRSSIRKA